MLSGWLKLEKEVGGPLFSSTEAEWLKPILSPPLNNYEWVQYSPHSHATIHTTKGTQLRVYSEWQLSKAPDIS
jgi:hypothetical protein